MKKNIAKGILLVGIFLSIASILPIQSASAHQINFFPSGYWGTSPNPILTCHGGAQTLDSSGNLVSNTMNGNHPCTPCEFIHTAQHIIYFILTLLVFIAVPALIMYGGVLILVSRGSSEKIGEGKKVITGALVGIALGLGAYILVNTFLTFLKPVVGGAGAWSSFSCSKIPAFLQ